VKSSIAAHQAEFPERDRDCQRGCRIHFDNTDGTATEQSGFFGIPGACPIDLKTPQFVHSDGCERP
jgi:hypothetical protein